MSRVNFDPFFSSKDLINRVLFLLMVLVVYRFGTFITLPSVNPARVSEIFAANLSSGVIGMFNTFSGGALGRMTLFALNIMPYIVSSIIVQVFFSMLKSEGKISSESISESKLSFYSKILALFLSVFQGFVIVIGLEKSQAFIGGSTEFYSLLRYLSVLSLVCGTFCLIWLGQQINTKGIGNGISMIIFTGIVAEMPSLFGNLFMGIGFSGSGLFNILGSLFLFTFIVALIVLVERSYRNIPVSYPRRRNWGAMYDSSSGIPVKLNVSGVIPPIFASALILFPLTLANFSSDGWLGGFFIKYFSAGQPLYFLLYSVLIVFFCFFYSDFVFNTKEISESLKKSEAIVAGRRPGVSTKNYLDYVLNRITVIGALYLVFVCVVPEVSRNYFGFNAVVSGASLLIIINVITDLITQIQVHLFSSQYASFAKKGGLVFNKR
ncbi:preprotein translocase, SecY subunit [Neorickettsia helminthoeca str. Oregon]|uniref:Protein translocase subunit SecY n=1 Tax=Neorickettsia helminthoeca str. Oregon TaxID=1286528 RepID=X5H3F3_9RICK|nr:preprotein translocase subunit SecY [Neorickettsia helminthoeca]AHX11228.1 preprotein translocase, SecY subunit [Neorickettsia helminthoeca str. Oregon]